MASGEDAVKVVDSSEVSAGGSLVHVESVEKTSLFSYFRSSKAEKEGEAKRADSKPSVEEQAKAKASASKHEVVRDGNEMKIAYDVEEDDPPSLLEQLKRKCQWNSR